jgi:alkyl sulfatase BDS1-like metallo-beta-lactamase superfamily hydrolase
MANPYKRLLEGLIETQGVQFTLDNGRTISIQQGKTHYATRFKSVEIATWIDEGEIEIVGEWTNFNDMLELLNKYQKEVQE